MAQSSRGVWGIASWARNDSIYLKPLSKFPSMRRTGESLVTTFEEKVNALRKTFFSSSPQVDISDILEAVYSSPLLMSSQITKEEIRKTIFRSKLDKASGVDNLLNRFLRLVTEKLLFKIRYLFQIYVDVSYHSKKFRKTNIIVLRKSKKKNYFESKSYRLITLLSTLEKILEIMIARRLSDYVEDNNLLSLEQMRVRRKRFTKIILETIVDAVHTVQNYKKNKVTSLLLLDIIEAFDNIFYYRLLHNLRQKGISKLIIN